MRSLDLGTLAVGLGALLAAGCGDSGGGGASDAGCASLHTADVEPASMCVEAGGVLRVTVDGCFCGSSLACTSELAADTVRFTTQSATCGTMCTECHPLIGDCRLPSGLAASHHYSVEVNGAFAFDVTTDPSGAFPATTCFDPAEPPPSAFTCTNDRLPVTAASACIPAFARSGSSVYVNATACVPCFAIEAGCDVVRADGPALHVTAWYRGCDCATCGACPGPCEDRTFTCALPPLQDGTGYGVDIGGRSSVISVSPTGTGNTDCASP